ncbi:MAG: NUDIX hydrolase [Spartobacteria bacterium]|nr:NUDIX hydrolase [Spartobacteria bacterium]
MNEKTLTKKTLYSGRILDLEIQDIEMENGTKSIRELIRHAPAVAVLCELPDGRFVFVKQFRKAIESDIVELVAGLCEKDEKPADAACRELMEETGYEATTLIPLGTVYPSPGYTDELIHLYFATLSEIQGKQDQDDDERVEVVYMTEAEIGRAIAQATIHDAKLIAAWGQYLVMIKYADDTAATCSTCACQCGAE